MNITNPFRDKFSGVHFSDFFYEWIKGYKNRDLATKDATQLSNEVWNYRNDLFPVRSIPVPDRPGYVTHSSNFFKIEFKGEKTAKNLTEYFTEEHYGHDGISYGSIHELGDFFELALHGLLVDGISIYAVEWEVKTIENRNYYLPSSFSWMNPATLKISEDENGILVKQMFSLITKFVNGFINQFYPYKNNEFRNEEVLIFKHPTLYPNSPVGKSLKYIKALKAGMDFSLWQGESSVKTENHTLPIEKGRYLSSTPYWRKQNIARGKVRRIFNETIGDIGLSITPYYEVFAFVEYKKHLNVLRDYFVEQFNQQVMKYVQQKNNFSTPINLLYKGFASNVEIEAAFKEFGERKINIKEFSEKVKDNYDTLLF